MNKSPNLRFCYKISADVSIFFFVTRSRRVGGCDKGGAAGVRN